MARGEAAGTEGLGGLGEERDRCFLSRHRRPYVRLHGHRCGAGVGVAEGGYPLPGVSRGSFKAFLEFLYVGRCEGQVEGGDGREL